VKQTFAADIRERDQVETLFLVKDKIMAMAKNGKPYMTLRLMDKSGEIEGRVWDNVDELAATFDRDDFVRVRGKASVYLGKMQLVIAELLRLPDDAVELADFLPESSRDRKEMRRQLEALVASLRDAYLRALMEAFLGDEPLMARYVTAPAAKGMHHVFVGGLLEHSLAVAGLVDAIVPSYPGLNRDLLVVGALLHDVGKVREMTYLRSFDYTDEGKLLGHITIGVEMVHEKVMAIPGFPEELALLIKHMILSHHGQYEFGSPKRPKTLEATVLNYLDDLDSKINGINSHMQKEPAEQRWTSYHRLYDRYFYRDRLGEQPAAESAPAATTPQAPVPAHPAPKEREKKGGQFGNNPFEKLKDANLDLF
jgi:3'-5' exoribonuclease